MDCKYITILFKGIIEHLNSNNIPYFIIRNYQGYPDKISGDIDIHFNPAYTDQVISIVNEMLNTTGWEIIFFNNSHTMISYQLFNKNISNDYRKIIVLEFFKGINLIGFEYLDFDSLYDKKINFNSINVLDENYGYFLSLVHYLSRAGFVPEKYHNFFIRSISNFIDNSDEFKEINKLNLFDKIQKFLKNNNIQYIKCDNIPEKIKILPHRLRLLIVFNLLSNSMKLSLNRFVKNIIFNFYLLIYRILNPKGLICVLECDRELFNSVFDKIKFYHLFKNSASIKITDKNYSSTKIRNTINNGGIVLINDKTIISKSLVKYEKTGNLIFLNAKETTFSELSIETIINDIIDKTIDIKNKAKRI